MSTTFPAAGTRPVHRWTAGRFAGIALLGLVACIASTALYAATTSGSTTADMNGGGNLGTFVATVLVLVGLVALAVGVVGAAVTLIRR